MEGRQQSGSFGHDNLSDHERTEEENGPPRVAAEIVPSTSWQTNLAGRVFKTITDPMRKVVSQNRRRMTNEKDNIDLDLTYITDRIIALGYPAEDFEKIYRNTMEDTQKFLNTYHPHNYLVFNLRGRFVYNPEKFENRVITFEMMDHHPPRLEYMAQFCREAHEYLEADPNHVIAVHCKAGKGRTGVMICAYLVYINYYPKARAIMDYYSIVRTTNNKGVTIPSQRRYIYYFDHLRKHQLNYLPLCVELVGIYIECPKENGSGKIICSVSIGGTKVFNGIPIKPVSTWAYEASLCKSGRREGPDSIDFSQNFYNNDPCMNIVSRRAYGWTVSPTNRTFLEGDVRIDFYQESAMPKMTDKLGHIWFNTMFVCPGYCETHFVHGDEGDPYPEGLSSISRRRSSAEVRPKTGSASEPSTRPVTDSARGSDKDLEIIEDQPTTSRPTDANRKKSKDEKKNNMWINDFEIIQPPGLELHCPSSSLASLHNGTTPPRYKIENLLIRAHEEDLVKDVYHQRRARLIRESSVEAIPAAVSTERPIRGGPFVLRRNPDEHVQCYPVYEIDRAAKKGTMSEHCKVFIVTRCLPQGHECVQFTQWEERKMRKEDSKGEKCGPIASSKYCITSKTEDDDRGSDERLGRYFTKMRPDSPSRYPKKDFECPLLKRSNGSELHAESSLIMNDNDKRCFQSISDCKEQNEEQQSECPFDTIEMSGSSSSSEESNGCD